MAFSVTHATTATGADDPTKEINKGEWNAGHSITGEIAVANGGTGLASGTSGGVLYFSAAGMLASSALLAANSLLIGAGAGAAPFTSANLTFGAATGEGLVFAAGTATTNVAAMSLTRTNNNAAVATGVKWTFTDTTSAAGFLAFQILGGSAATTNLLSLSKEGLLTSAALTLGSATPATGTQGQFYQGANATQIEFGSSTPVLRFLQGEVDMVQNCILAWGNQTNTFTASSTQLVLSKQANGVLQVGTTTSNSLGSIRCKFQSSDGTAGVSFGPAAVASITVKDGIITAIS